MRTRDIFVDQNGWLLVDEMIELGLEPATTATPAPLDEAMLQALAIIGFAPEDEPGIVSVDAIGDAIAMQPGDTTKLVLGVFDYEVCGTGFRCFVPVAAAATWSVTPADGARIDPATGILSIDSSTPSGSVFTARAEIEGGHHVVETQVKTSRQRPIHSSGTGGGGATGLRERTEVAPALAIRELIFDPDGSFAVTWVPFESYKDYWGTYTFDLSQGTLELTVTGGNTIPPDVDGEGRFASGWDGRPDPDRPVAGNPEFRARPTKLRPPLWLSDRRRTISAVPRSRSNMRKLADNPAALATRSGAHSMSVKRKVTVPAGSSAMILFRTRGWIVVLADCRTRVRGNS